MKLKEYEAKKVLAEAGIKTPKGLIVKKGSTYPKSSQLPADKVVVKAQIEIGGRGKAGGILMADSSNFKQVTDELFEKTIKGLPVEEVLIEERIDIRHEYYLSITIDRASGAPLFLFTSEGGVEIEVVAKNTPEKIHTALVNPLLDTVPDYVIRSLIKDEPKEIGLIIRNLYQVFRKKDAMLVEINPLVLTPDGIFAADAKIIIDDNALARQGIVENRDLNPREKKAEEFGFSFVELDGEIGVIGNGAGLTMATLDLIALNGGKPANFLDVGGGADRERVAHALRLLGTMENIRVIIVNLLGGITRCDEVAYGIIEANVAPKIIVRLAGTNEKEGREILNKAGHLMLETMEEAVSAGVEYCKTGSFS